ncbi:MAG: 3'(2'),5'-bisphosphate nucleotidase CysQ [Pseudomonadota bacterium]
MDHDQRTAIEAEIRRLALAGGAAIMEIYRSGALETEAKADDSPVTAADLAADRLIGAGLAAAFPDIPAVTEEQAESHTQQGLTRFFLVDPLDGTKEFVQRRGEFTVNIALIENGVPVAGVVYAPAKGRLFATHAGGAIEQTIEDGAPVAGSERAITVATPGEHLSVVASKSHRDAATDAYIARYPVGDFLSAGSSLKFCLVAAGEAHLYPRLGRTMEWDTAAGDAVLRAAGGQMVRFEDHAPFAYAKPGFENGHFIAYAPGVTLQQG